MQCTSPISTFPHQQNIDSLFFPPAYLDVIDILIKVWYCKISKCRMVHVLFVSLITMGIAILDPTNQLEGRLFPYCPTVRLRTDNLYQIKFWIFAEIWRPCRHCGQFFGKLSSQQNRKRLVSDPSSGLVCNMVWKEDINIQISCPAEKLSWDFSRHLNVYSSRTRLYKQDGAPLRLKLHFWKILPALSLWIWSVSKRGSLIIPFWWKSKHTYKMWPTTINLPPLSQNRIEIFL